MTVNAICAICELPLIKLQQCVSIGCEIVHRECAMSCRKTRGQKLAERVAEFGVETERFARAALTERDAKVAMGKALLAERQAKEFALERAFDADTQRREAMAECVRLRAELAVMRDPTATISRESAKLATTRDMEVDAQGKLAATRDVAGIRGSDEAEDGDDAAARFRLMELD